MRVAHPFAHFAKGWDIAGSAIAFLVILRGAFPSTANAQKAGTINNPIHLSVCDVRDNYKRYAGKFVSFRATLLPGLEILGYTGDGCEAVLPIESPEDFDVIPRPSFHTLKDESFERYQNTPTDPPSYSADGYWPQTTYSLTVTYTGRLDVAPPKAPGYGHLNFSRARLVLLSVSDVVATVSHAKHDHNPPGSLGFPTQPPPNLYQGSASH
jgi:hypothetical protein